MIKVNGEIVNIEHFPDGTPRIYFDTDIVEEFKYKGSNYIQIEWFYESDNELFYLMLVKKHLERYFVDVNYELYMPYIPNARMDRTKHDKEVFTLKYFCDFINNLNFDSVFVLDAHSDVSVALLNNCVNESPKEYVEKVIVDNLYNDISAGNLVLYFPDAGASKKYSNMFPEFKYVYGNKVRTWETGEITGIEIVTPFDVNLTNKTILIIDDIIAYGGSMYFGANKLKKLGVGKIYAYATHTENSVIEKGKSSLLKSLENGDIEKLFTTNSLFSGEHEKIEVIEL